MRYAASSRPSPSTRSSWRRPASHLRVTSTPWCEGARDQRRGEGCIRELFSLPSMQTGGANPQEQLCVAFSGHISNAAEVAALYGMGAEIGEDANLIYS